MRRARTSGVLLPASHGLRRGWIRFALLLALLVPIPSVAEEAAAPDVEPEAEVTEEATEAPGAPDFRPKGFGTIFGVDTEDDPPWWDQGWSPRDIAVTRPFGLASFFTGPWFGLRSKLYEWGFDLRGEYHNQVMGNPSGGNRQGGTYTHNLGLELIVLLDKLASWKGARFRMKYSQRSGDNLSDKKVGNTWQIQHMYGGQNHKLVNVQLEQSLWDDRFNLSIGRIVYNDEFQKSPIYCQFLNNAFCGIPIAPFRNVPDGVTTYPWATWGARIRVRPTEETYAMIAVYDGEPYQDGKQDNGTKWDFGHNKTFTAWEAGWTPQRGLFGMPSAYKVGGWYHAGDFEDLTKDEGGGNKFLSGWAGRKRQGNTGVYISFDQTLYQESPESHEGLVAFGSFNIGVQKNRTELPIFYVAGLQYKGPIPGRPHDIAVFGVAQGLYRRELRQAQREAGIPEQKSELVLEWNYHIQLTPYLYFRPDMQFILDPGGADNIDNAFAMGFEMGIRF